MEKFQFHYSVAYSAPVECKIQYRNNRQHERNYRLIFGELKNRIIGDVSSIIYQGLALDCWKGWVGGDEGVSVDKVRCMMHGSLIPRPHSAFSCL